MIPFLELASGVLLLTLSICGMTGQRDSKQARLFRVEDYGAQSDSRKDASPALRRAIAEAAKSGEPAVVQFGAGSYHIAPEPGQPFCATLQGVKNITVRGVPGRTKLILTQPRSGAFLVSQSDNVTIRDLIIDFDPLPYTQGHIVAVNRQEGTFDFDLQAGYPSLSEAWFRTEDRFGRWGMIFDRHKRRLKTGAPDHVFIEDWKQIQGRRWRMKVSATHLYTLASMEAGDRYVHMARVGFGAVMLDFSRNCSVENLTVHASSGLAVALVGNEDSVTVRRLRVRFPEKTDRLLTTNSDGIHCQQNRCGPRIERCEFEGMADDAINIYTPPNIIAEILSPTEILTTAGCRLRTGDRFQVFDPARGVIRAEVSAKEVHNHARGYRLVLDRPVEGMRAGQTSREADSLLNLSACGAGFVIENCVMRGHRRFGIFIKATDGRIENNTIDNVCAYGIVIQNDPEWPEGPVPRRLLIRGNRIRGTATSGGYPQSPHSAALQVLGLKLGFQLSEERIVSDIVIENNTITDPPGSGICVGSSQNIVLRKNRIEWSPAGKSRASSVPIRILNSVGVVQEGNTIRLPTERK
jgi:parallel beta-helix repeat protein